MPFKIAPHGEHDDIIYPSAIPFVLVHVACIAVLWTGITWEAVALCIGLYWLRIFAIGAGYHRYFSHRAYSTGRVFQFVLAFLAQSTAQKSVLWWAAKHRHHHLHSDTEQDVHSPRHTGFIYSHLGWIFARQHGDVDLAKVADLARYPGVDVAAPAGAGAGRPDGRLCFLIAGWPGLVVGFFWSTVSSTTPRSASIRSPMFAAASGMLPGTIPATIGSSRCSPWARAGTTITTPTRAAFARAFAGGRSTRPTTF